MYINNLAQISVLMVLWDLFGLVLRLHLFVLAQTNITSIQIWLLVTERVSSFCGCHNFSWVANLCWRFWVVLTLCACATSSFFTHLSCNAHAIVPGDLSGISSVVITAWCHWNNILRHLSSLDILHNVCRLSFFDFASLKYKWNIKETVVFTTENEQTHVQLRIATEQSSQLSCASHLVHISWSADARTDKQLGFIWWLYGFKKSTMVLGGLQMSPNSDQFCNKWAVINEAWFVGR